MGNLGIMINSEENYVKLSKEGIRSWIDTMGHFRRRLIEKTEINWLGREWI